MNTIKILFLKKKQKLGGVTVIQNIMFSIFSGSPEFKLVIMDEQPKSKNTHINNTYNFIQSISIINTFLNYIYLLFQVIKNRKDADYLFLPHPFKYGLFAILVSSLFKIPFIVPILGWEEKELRLRGASQIEIFLRLKYESWLYRKAKYLLASDDLISAYSKIVKNKNKFLSFYSLIDTDRFTPMPKSEILRNKLGVGTKRVILSVTGTQGPKAEGLRMLLEAFTILREDCNNITLLIAGKGRQYKEFENIIKKMNVDGYDIRLLGHCDNMPELINLSDFFTLIFPFAGGVGLAIMEAMACGKPCAVSRTPGTEFFTDGKEVLLVNFDPKDIADKIRLLLMDEDYAREMGINARKRIETECSIKVGKENLFNKLSENRLP
jgi:glycosyltransferase involved in cell wall biosynthesis